LGKKNWKLKIFYGPFYGGSLVGNKLIVTMENTTYVSMKVDMGKIRGAQYANNVGRSILTVINFLWELLVDWLDEQVD
jgi:hypothetical protein